MRKRSLLFIAALLAAGFAAAPSVRGDSFASTTVGVGGQYTTKTDATNANGATVSASLTESVDTMYGNNQGAGASSFLTISPTSVSGNITTWQAWDQLGAGGSVNGWTDLNPLVGNYSVVGWETVTGDDIGVPYFGYVDLKIGNQVVPLYGGDPLYTYDPSYPNLGTHEIVLHTPGEPVRMSLWTNISTVTMDSSAILYFGATITPAPVPEPSTGIMTAGFAVIALWLWRFRKHRNLQS